MSKRHRVPTLKASDPGFGDDVQINGLVMFDNLSP